MIVHDLTPNGGGETVREIPLFQGNLGWCNLRIWPVWLEDDPFLLGNPPTFRGYVKFPGWVEALRWLGVFFFGANEAVLRMGSSHRNLAA